MSAEESTIIAAAASAEQQTANPSSWRSPIFFPVYPAHSKKDDIPAILSNPPVAMDICEFLGGGRVLDGNDRLYVCPRAYPPPISDDNKQTKEAKFRTLSEDIKDAAKKAGSPISVGKGNRIGTHTYQCIHECRRLKLPAAKRNEILTCKFQFSVKNDANGFFITLYGGAGNGNHTGHTPISDKPAKTSAKKTKAKRTSKAQDDGAETSNAKRQKKGSASGDSPIRQRFDPLWNEIMSLHESMNVEENDAELEGLLKNHLAKMQSSSNNGGEAEVNPV